MIRLTVLVLATCSSVFGYIRLTTPQPVLATDPPSVVLTRPDASSIQVYINNLLVAGLQSNASGSNVTVLAPGSDPVAAARAALATWNASGAKINFLPLQTTTAGHDESDGKMVITLATTASDLSFVGGAVAVTDDVFATGPGTDPDNPIYTVDNGSVVDSDIMLNPAMTFTTDGSGSADTVSIANGNVTQDLQSVLTHELGHLLGANHTGILGATMFQFAGINQRYLSQDDIAFVNLVYPPSAGLNFGTIQGKVTAGSSAPVSYGMLTVIDTAQELTFGGLTNVDGTYSIKTPPGSYVIYAEPFNTIIQPGNLYLTVKQAQAVPPFQSTFYGTLANPSTVTVTSGNTATANFSVTAGTTNIQVPFIGFGGAGKTGDVSTYIQPQGPVLVPAPPGQSFDMAFGGPGFDGTLTAANISLLGGGVTIGGPIRTDTTKISGGLPVQRVTLNVSPTQASTLATIFINKGGNTLSLSAVLVVTPPTPAFTPASVVNAASYQGSGGSGAVSPGGIYAIFAQDGTSYLGPATLVSNIGQFDPYGNLPVDLAGVRVTFDGVPAPLFYVWGQQIAVQVPFEVAGKQTTNVVVSYFGSASPPISVPVFAVQAAFFADAGDISAALIYNNDDNFRNSAAHPVKQGKFVLIYGTGVGVTSLGAAGYGLQTGHGAPSIPAGYGSGNFSCTVGNGTVSNTVDAFFGGWTPTLVGLAQFNLQVPSGLTGKLNVQCRDKVSGSATQVGVIYVN